MFLKTARFAVEAGIDLPRFAVVTPFPGTALYQRLEAEGRILTRNWELYDGQHVVFQPAQMSVERAPARHRDRLEGAPTACPSMAQRLAILGRAPGRCASVTNLGYRFYAHNLHRFYNCDWMLSRAQGGSRLTASL